MSAGPCRYAWRSPCRAYVDGDRARVAILAMHVAFTGILTRRRDVAVRAARRAGATVHGSASAKTTVVVRGRPNPLQAAGREGGRKLMEIKRLREKGIASSC